MKMRMWIVLPEHKQFEIWLRSPDKEWTKEAFDNEVSAYRETFSTCISITIAIINENGEKESLVLWGDILKKIYIRAQLK